jgi:signal transduction histidine kinase/DNA-binding NarL/FixJ family response regulator
MLSRQLASLSYTLPEAMMAVLVNPNLDTDFPHYKQKEGLLKLQTLYFNPALASMLEFEYATNPQQAPLYGLAPDLAQRDPIYRKIVLEGKTISIPDVKIVIKGEEKYFSVTYSPLVETPDSKGMLVLAIEITPQLKLKALEEACAQEREKQENLNCLVNATSHEYKNLLQEFLYLLELEQKTVSRLLALPPDTRIRDTKTLFNKLQSINNTVKLIAEHFQSLSQAILRLQAFKTGKGLLNNNIIDIQDILQNLSLLFSYRATLHKVHFTCKCELDSPYIKGDKDAILISLINLITNALKFTPEEGSIEVTVRCNPSAKLVFSIRDTGNGISKEKIPLLFKSFSKLDPLKEGTGVGLTITQSFIEALGGKIEVSSIVAVGSTFTFILPYHSPTQEEIAQHTTAKQKQQKNQQENHLKIALSSMKKRVLCVDDNPMLLSIWQKKFEALGWSCITESSSIHAKGLCSSSSTPFDIIIVDANMPELSGFDLAQHFKTECFPVPHLFLCTGDDTSHVPETHPELFSGFIPKPSTPQELYEILDKTLSLQPKAPLTSTPHTQLRRLWSSPQETYQSRQLSQEEKRGLKPLGPAPSKNKTKPTQTPNKTPHRHKPTLFKGAAIQGAPTRLPLPLLRSPIVIPTFWFQRPRQSLPRPLLTKTSQTTLTRPQYAFSFS